MEAIAMMEKALEIDSNYFPANILAAMFNTEFGRNERAKMYFSRARDVAGPDHGLVRVVQYMIARNSGEKELAEEIKAGIKDDMAASRIGWATLFISWDGDEVEQVFDLAIQQRNPDIFPRLFRSKAPGLSDEAWLRIRKTTRTSEAPVGNATLWVLRTHEEQARLKNQAIALPEESLDSYAGVYERKSNRVRNTFSLQDQKLVRVSSSGSVTDLVPMGDHLFEDLKFKRTHQFIEKDGAFSSLVVTVGQQTTVWEKVESGSL
jgi:hypothetical protein